MRNVLAALTLSAIAFGATSAKADFCNDKVSELVNQQLASQYQTATADIQDMMGALEAVGKQNSKAYQQLQAALSNASTEFSQKGTQVAQRGIDECRQGLAPFQLIADAIMVDLTGGLSLILPKHMTHIDMGEILSGNLGGGDNSVIHRPLGDFGQQIGLDIRF